MRSLSERGRERLEDFDSNWGVSEGFNWKVWVDAL